MTWARWCPSGEGDGQFRELLAALQETGFDGFFSIEPHLGDFDAFGGLCGPDLWRPPTQPSPDSSVTSACSGSDRLMSADRLSGAGCGARQFLAEAPHDYPWGQSL